MTIAGGALHRSAACGLAIAWSVAYLVISTRQGRPPRYTLGLPVYDPPDTDDAATVAGVISPPPTMTVPPNRGSGAYASSTRGN
jgi:hypothetical protein